MGKASYSLKGRFQCSDPIKGDVIKGNITRRPSAAIEKAVTGATQLHLLETEHGARCQLAKAVREGCPASCP